MAAIAAGLSSYCSAAVAALAADAAKAAEAALAASAVADAAAFGLSSCSAAAAAMALAADAAVEQNAKNVLSVCEEQRLNNNNGIALTYTKVYVPSDCCGRAYANKALFFCLILCTKQLAYFDDVAVWIEEAKHLLPPCLLLDAMYNRHARSLDALKHGFQLFCLKINQHISSALTKSRFQALCLEHRFDNAFLPDAAQGGFRRM